MFIQLSNFRGKGDGFRLGHGTEEHIRYPKVVEALYGKKVVDISVGSVHCVAVTEDGEVYSWGRNDQGQLGDTFTTTRAEPTIIAALEGKGISGVSCGPAQVKESALLSCAVGDPRDLLG